MWALTRTILCEQPENSCVLAAFMKFMTESSANTTEDMASKHRAKRKNILDERIGPKIVWKTLALCLYFCMVIRPAKYPEWYGATQHPKEIL